MIHAILGTGRGQPDRRASVGARGDCSRRDQDVRVMLRKVEPPVQVALIEGLSQRGDVSAAPAIAAMVSSTSPEVRLAAINALGILGDATMVPLLGVAAASRTAKNKRPPGWRWSNCGAAIRPRRCSGSCPTPNRKCRRNSPAPWGIAATRPLFRRLVELARQGSGSAGKAALQALALLVEDSQVGLMVQFVVDAKTEAARADAAEALNSACHQILTRRGQVNVEPLLQASGDRAD